MGDEASGRHSAALLSLGAGERVVRRCPGLVTWKKDDSEDVTSQYRIWSAALAVACLPGLVTSCRVTKVMFPLLTRLFLSVLAVSQSAVKWSVVFILVHDKVCQSDGQEVVRGTGTSLTWNFLAADYVSKPTPGRGSVQHL